MDQIDEFLSDSSQEAYTKLVDRLLESPHYGERWARHWLDVVRFGESNGFEYDQPRNNAWYYRNWVITALNRTCPTTNSFGCSLPATCCDPMIHNRSPRLGSSWLEPTTRRSLPAKKCV